MDLSTTYLGLTLRSPLVGSASPVTGSLDGARALADAGAGAVVLPSLFEEQVRAQELEDLLVTERHEESFGEALDYLPRTSVQVTGGTAPYLRQLEATVAALDVPVIASLNGSTPGGWTAIASSMESAGAAALELNIYAVPGTAAMSGVEVEQQHVEILGAVRQVVSIPVAVKLSPFFSATAAMASALDAEGADGLVLFNRFLPPDVDTETMRVEPGVRLSEPGEGRLPRTWIAILRHQVRASLAGTSGVETADDVAAYLLSGADVVMTASAVLRHGPAYLGELLVGLESWLVRKGFSGPQDARGLLAVPDGTDPTAAQRAGYVAALRDAQRTYGSLRG